MTTTGKVVIGGVALAAIGGAAYYFLVAKKQVQSLLPQATPSNPTPTTATTTAVVTTANPAAAATAASPAAAANPAAPYEGKVIRADQEPAVYEIINGVRHGFLSPDALHRAGFDFPQVISLPKAFVMSIPEGSHISGLRGFTVARMR